MTWREKLVVHILLLVARHSHAQRLRDRVRADPGDAMTAASLPDRRVHAECATFEVVRYEKAGKWFVESKVPLVPCEHIGVSEAAHRAVAAEALGGEINRGIPGGKVFDRKVAMLDV